MFKKLEDHLTKYLGILSEVELERLVSFEVFQGQYKINQHKIPAKDMRCSGCGGEGLYGFLFVEPNEAGISWFCSNRECLKKVKNKEV